VADLGVAGKVFVRSLGREVVEEEETVEIAVSVEDGDVDFGKVGAAEGAVETGAEVAGTADVEIVVCATVDAESVAAVVEFEVNV
jgi:hypothetical protein